MELYFYSKSSKPFGKGLNSSYAEIILNNKRGWQNKFLETDKKLCGITVFQSRHLNHDYCSSKNGEEIAEVIKKYAVEVILETSELFMKELIKEIDIWDILPISNEERLLYGLIGEDNCALVLAYKKK